MKHFRLVIHSMRLALFIVVTLTSLYVWNHHIFPDRPTVERTSSVQFVAPDPFLQVNFPCAEDERLGYHPRFGPDRVGCIHIDEED